MPEDLRQGRLDAFFVEKASGLIEDTVLLSDVFSSLTAIKPQHVGWTLEEKLELASESPSFLAELPCGGEGSHPIQELTKEQIKRVGENRQRALEKKRQRQVRCALPVSTAAQPFCSRNTGENPKLTDKEKRQVEKNRQRALERKLHLQPSLTKEESELIAERREIALERRRRLHGVAASEGVVNHHAGFSRRSRTPPRRPRRNVEEQMTGSPPPMWVHRVTSAVNSFTQKKVMHA